jgi:hypothetical protein
MIYKVEQARIGREAPDPPRLAIGVTGEVSMPGWTQFALQPAQYGEPPADGIYDIFWTGMPPGGFVPPVIAPVQFGWTWVDYPTDLKGVRVHTQTSVVEALLDYSSEPA